MTTEARLDLRVLAQDDVRRVHDAALTLLGDRAAGVATLLAAPPPVVTLPGRVPEHDLTLDARSCRLAVGALERPPVRVAPLGDGEPHAATAADLEECCRLADALPEVALLVAPPVSVEAESALGAVARCLQATTRHLLVTTLRTAAEGRAAARLGAAVAADGRGVPVSVCGNGGALHAVLAAAESGLPVGLVLSQDGAASATLESSGGITAALVRHHAGVLAGLAAVRAAAPGAPFLYVAAPGMAGLPPAGPQAALFQLAAAQLADVCGLPLVAGGMVSGSHLPDWQACTQNAFSAMSTTLAGAAVTAGAGTLSSGAVLSFEQLVMDSEIFSWNAAIARGVDVDDDTIALDVIKDVGIGGNYLSRRHTRRHMRDVWRPRLLDRSMWDAWVASGREGACEKATALARTLLAEHQVPPLPEQVRATLARIVAEAGL